MVDDRQHSEADQIKDFWALLKPRVMYLVVFTGAVGMWLAPGKVHPFIACLAVVCIALGSGAAGAINMWYERHLDAKMARTKHRPLPKGRMLPSTAIEFSVIMAVASVTIMMVAVNMMAAFLLLVAILFYVFIYTIWLKPRSVQNIVIGGAAGAFPPMIGWAAVTGDISVESVVLFVIIFMWTPPHFWALSLYRSDDYARVGIPMLPVVKGRRSTLKHIFWYSIALVWVSLLPVMIGMLDLVYGVTALLLGMRFVLLALRLYQEYQESKARALFGYSIVYLFVLFVAMVVDRVVLA